MRDIIVKSIMRNKLFKDASCIPEDFLNLNLSINCIRESKILFRKGQEIKSIFLLQSGEINHFVENEDGKTNVISYRGGDFIPRDFSDSSLSDSTAIAVRDTYYYELDKNAVIHFLNTNQKIKENYYNFSNLLHGQIYEQPSFVYKTTSGKEENSEVREEINKNEKDKEENRATTNSISEEKITEETSHNKIDLNKINNLFNPENPFDIVRYNDIDILTVNIKEATLTYTPKLKSVLTKMIDEGTYKLIVDLDYCDIIDSTFLGTLVVILKRIGSIGGEMRLVCGNKPAWLIFEMTGMGKVFNTSSDLKSAIEEFYT